MSENLSTQKEIDQSNKFVAFAFSSADILIEVDDKCNIRFIDGATKGLLGYKSEELKDRNLLDFIHVENQDSIQKIISATNATARVDSLRVRMTSRDKKDVYFVFSGYRLPYLGNSFFLTLSHLKLSVRSEQIAQRDFRTGLLNREAFAWEANKMLMASKPRNNTVTMSMIDLSGLSKVVEELNAEKFDELFSDIASYLRSVSIDGDAAAIIDANHMSLIHDQSLSTSDITSTIKEKVRKVTKSPIDVLIRTEGVEMRPVQLNDYDAAKVVQFTINKFAQNKSDDFSLSSLAEGYHDMLGDTLARTREFKDIIYNNRFDLAFQPIMDIESNEVHHFEVLVRLVNSPMFESPLSFITFGERSGFVAEFDLAMCQRAIGTLHDLSADGKHPSVSVNVSGRSLSSRLFREAFKGVLDANPEVRQQIMIEITESSRITEPVLVNDFLQELRISGNICCLDDFGSAESSFDYIRMFEVDYIKIDGSYVRNCLASDRSKYLLKSMINICNELEIDIVAEMIGNNEIVEFLKSCGVKYGQGFFLEKPTTDFKELLSRRKYIDIGKSKLNIVTVPTQRKFRDSNRRWWAKDKPAA